jgi:hypothetical protein
VRAAFQLQLPVASGWADLRFVLLAAVVATRDKVDHKLSCPRCSGRWSDLNCFKKHVREICPPSRGRSTAQSDSRRCPPPTALPRSSPVSSVPSSTPPVTPEAMGGTIHAMSWASSDDAFYSRRRQAPSPPSKPKVPANERYRMEPVVRTMVFPPSVALPLPRPSRLISTESLRPLSRQPVFPPPEASPPTSSRTQRKRLIRAVDRIWAPIEREAGVSLNAAYDEQEAGKCSSAEHEQLAATPWWAGVGRVRVPMICGFPIASPRPSLRVADRRPLSYSGRRLRSTINDYLPATILCHLASTT